MSLVEEMRKHPVIGDGAMGTLLYSYGVGHCYEELNVSRPDQVVHIHRAYLTAGAQVIQTNTYGASREKLAKYGLSNQTKQINRLGVQHALTAVAEHKKAAASSPTNPTSLTQPLFVVGTIGGLHSVSSSPINMETIRANVLEQLDVLLSAGVDGILLETYYDPDELTEALRLARRYTHLPIIAQMALHEPGVVQGGLSLSDTLSKLEDLGADVVGLNCRLGPYHIIQSLEQINKPESALLSAYPNAGLPSYTDGVYEYSSSPEYFEQSGLTLASLGVKLIGGCCGTTPEHIKHLRKGVEAQAIAPGAQSGAASHHGGTGQDVRGDDAQERLEVKHNRSLETDHKIQARTSSAEVEQRTQHAPYAADHELHLHELARQKTSIIVELDPPRKLDTTAFFRGAQALQKAGIDALTLADNSLASPRISNVAMATILKETYQIRSLVHVACRDRNLIGQQSHLLGLATLGLNQLLAITGDPAKVGDFPGASSVFDLSSIELMRLIKQCNEGISFSGQPLGGQTNFSVAGAFNPHVRHLDKAVLRLEKKIENGMDYIMTQPVYSTEQIENIYEATKHLPTPVYLGIMPLIGYRNAEFLHNEVPGIKLTDEVRQIMQKHEHDKEQSRREGVAIAKSLLDCALQYFNGIYLITPFMLYQMTVELTEYIRQKQSVHQLAGADRQ